MSDKLGETSPSSVRSYLLLNTPRLFVRSERGVYRLRPDLFGESDLSFFDQQPPLPNRSFSYKRTRLDLADCFTWLRDAPENSLQAIVTDPPYGLIEYSDEEKSKLRLGKGGVWRIPPSFDGAKRSPLPRFTVLKQSDLRALHEFFRQWGALVLRVAVPGANVIVASNPLLSHIVAAALAEAGLERRGEIVRLVRTMRGGDRPKAAHEEFDGVSVMPRSMWEPWLMFRKPIEGRVQDNLRKWKVGGFRRPSADKPFGDVITSSPTRAAERAIAPHPSLKPQAFMRQLVRGALPLGEGIVCDPFSGGGSTLAAAAAIGYQAIGIEKDETFFELATTAIPRLAELKLS
ncbi:MAG: DNA methyltransferase, partial [Lysobacter sp.]